jgi:hypothetical protein
MFLQLNEQDNRSDFFVILGLMNKINTQNAMKLPCCGHNLM